MDNVEVATDEDEGHQADTNAEDDYEDDDMADPEFNGQVEEGINYFEEEDDSMEGMYA